MAIWNLKDIYEFENTDKIISELKEKVNKFVEFRDQLNERIDSQLFLKMLKEKEKISEISSNLSAYSYLWLSENTKDPKRSAYVSKIDEVLADIGNQMLFFPIWFKDLDEEAANRLMMECEEYNYTLKRMRAFKKHTLNESEEQIINLKDLSGCSALTKIYDIITNKFKFVFDGKELSQEEVNQYKVSPDKDKRKLAYDIVLLKYKEEMEVLGEIYITLMNDWKNENLKLRHYESPIKVRDLSNDIPSEAIKVLLKVVRENIGVFQEYFKLKYKLCGLDDYSRYDIYVPYLSEEKEYPYEECKEITLNLYKEFSEVMYEAGKKIFDEGHIHSDLTPNKMSGAYCSSFSTKITPYILLNHLNKLNNLSTMVHEVGHGIHNILASRNNNHFTFHACLPLQETASNFGETLLMQKMIREAKDDKEKTALLIKSIDRVYASIPRQAYFVLFEIEAHKRIAEGASLEDLNKLYMENLKEQFGDMDIPEVFKYEWIYISHIFQVPFYCYAYVFGQLLVLALYKMYKEQKEKFVPIYVKILSQGGSKPCGDILKEIGIDIMDKEFWQKGFDIIKEQVEMLRSLALGSL